MRFADHVSFAYDEDTKVLNDVSFQIKPERPLHWLVLPELVNNHRKSNQSFYDIQQGNIYIDGYNIRKYPLRA